MVEGPSLPLTPGDGYAMAVIENQRWIDSSQQLQDLRNAADGYTYGGNFTFTDDGYISTVGAISLDPGDGYVHVYGDLEIHGQAYTLLTTSNKPTGAQQTINWNFGNVQILSLASASGTVSVDFINPMTGGVYILKIIQHASVAKNITWTSACAWSGGGTPPTITATANAIDTVFLLYDGNRYYCNVFQNYI
jgi:hypothetical protein